MVLGNPASKTVAPSIHLWQRRLPLSFTIMLWQRSTFLRLVLFQPPSILWQVALSLSPCMYAFRQVRL